MGGLNKKRSSREQKYERNGKKHEVDAIQGSLNFFAVVTVLLQKCFSKYFTFERSVVPTVMQPTAAGSYCCFELYWDLLLQG